MAEVALAVCSEAKLTWEKECRRSTSCEPEDDQNKNTKQPEHAPTQRRHIALRAQ
jgi:hypothetical protein